MLAPDTQATLLLTGRLGGGEGEFQPLRTPEYNRLALELRALNLRPSNLLDSVPLDILAVEPTRLKALMQRGTQMALALDRWQRAGITVVGRTEERYPRRVRAKLRATAAPILYGVGPWELLANDALCVVGSRDASDEGLRFAHRVGRDSAAAGVTVVSGDARGIDRTAMDGALEGRGTVIGVLAEELLKTALSKRYRASVMDGRTLLLSPFDPEQRFLVAHAMDRNKYLYALSDVAVIADSDTKGGTWSGAVENQRQGWTRAYVRVSDNLSDGNQALVRMGLTPLRSDVSHGGVWIRDLVAGQFPGPAVEGAAAEEPATSLNLPGNGSPAIPPDAGERTSDTGSTVEAAVEVTALAPATPARLDPVAASPVSLPTPGLTELYQLFLDRLKQALAQRPQGAVEIASTFELVPQQVKAWLERAQVEGHLSYVRKSRTYHPAEPTLFIDPDRVHSSH